MLGLYVPTASADWSIFCQQGALNVTGHGNNKRYSCNVTREATCPNNNPPQVSQTGIDKCAASGNADPRRQNVSCKNNFVVQHQTGLDVCVKPGTQKIKPLKKCPRNFSLQQDVTQGNWDQCVEQNNPRRMVDSSCPAGTTRIRRRGRDVCGGQEISPIFVRN